MVFTEEEKKACLARIDFQKELTLTKECLDQLVFAQQSHIPYDNLDVYDYDREISLDPKRLFQKIVVKRRGGYCFELNGFFCGLLQSIGFDAKPCYCRIMFGPVMGPQDNFIDHRATIVTLDGKRYFCDVGTGAPMPLGAIEADLLDVWQETRGQKFCIRDSSERGWKELWRSCGDEAGVHTEHLDLYFLDAAVQECDFLTPNYYMSTCKESLPHVRRMVSIKMERGYRDLTNDVYTEVDGEVRMERQVPYEELLPLIRDKFGIDITEPLRKR